MYDFLDYEEPGSSGVPAGVLLALAGFALGAGVLAWNVSRAARAPALAHLPRLDPVLDALAVQEPTPLGQPLPSWFEEPDPDRLMHARIVLVPL